jgi:predicted lipoprotein with Yx(FWY)xxD motif
VKVHTSDAKEEHTVRYPIALVAAAASLAATIAGCGSSSKSTSTTAATSAGSAAQTTPAPTGSGYGGSSSAATTTSAVLVTSKHAKLGTILAAGPKLRTVYLFEGDKGSASSCAGACTHVWPPVTSTGEPKSGGSAMASHLGTIARADGTKQVTYNGHPLYYFARDGDRSDTYGQGVNGFGASWYVISPSGSKVDHS